MNYNIVSGRVDSQKIIINKQELALRLKTETGYENKIINECESELLKVVDCKYAFVKVPILLTESDVVDFGFCKVKSKDLYKNLLGCKSAYIFAVTTGLGVDRHLAKLNVLSGAKCFITDAISSAFAESLCDYVDKQISENEKTKPRFSPGYGDLPLEIQTDVLRVLSADKTLGITLNSSLLMTPVKSITAIMGVIEN